MRRECAVEFKRCLLRVRICRLGVACLHNFAPSKLIKIEAPRPCKPTGSQHSPGRQRRAYGPFVRAAKLEGTHRAQRSARPPRLGFASLGWDLVIKEVFTSTSLSDLADFGRSVFVQIRPAIKRESCDRSPFLAHSLQQHQHDRQVPLDAR